MKKSGFYEGKSFFTFCLLLLLKIDVCTSALSEVIPAVLDGSDGCLLVIGYPGSGKTENKS